MSPEFLKSFLACYNYTKVIYDSIMAIFYVTDLVDIKFLPGTIKYIIP